MRTRVDSQGQVTIPPLIRESLGVSEGDDVEFRRDALGKTYIEKASPEEPMPDRWERIRGTSTSGLTTDEIMAITRGDE